MDEETFLDHLEPLINREAHRQYLPGLDEDDRRQEFRLLAVRCKRKYDPVTKPGYEGRPSSFLHYFIQALGNRCAKLAARGNRQHGGVTRLACAICAWEKPASESGCCYQCGGDVWQRIYPNAPVSLDALLDETLSGVNGGGGHHRRTGQDSRLPSTPFRDPVAETELLRVVLAAVRPEDRREFFKALDNGRLRMLLREQIKIRLAANWRVYLERRDTTVA